MTVETTDSPVGQTKHVRWRKFAFGAIFLVLAFGFLGYFVLPPVAKSLAVGRLAEVLHRPVSIERIDFNPYTFELEIGGVAIQEKGGGEAVASFDRLYVNVDAGSLWRGGPVVSELRLSGPAVRVVRLPDGRLNFSDLIDEWLARPKDDEPTPAFSLNNIQISNGQIDFDDRMLAEKHRISEMTIGLPFISSLPDATEIFVEPVFSAVFDGSPVAIKGKSKLFAASLESELAFDLHDVRIGRYLNYLPSRLPVVWRDGGLDLDLKLTFRRRNDDFSALVVSGHTVFKDVAIDESSGSPLLSAKRLAVQLAEVDPLARIFTIDQVTIDAAEVHARVSRQGTLNWLELIDRKGTAGDAKADRPAAVETPSARWSVGEVKVADGTLHWLDESHGRPFKARVDALALTLRKLAAEVNEPAELSADWRLAAEPWVTLKAVSLKGGRLDLARQALTIDEIDVHGSQTLLKRAANGAIDFVPTPALRASAASQKKQPPWKVTVGKLRGDEGSLRFEDAAVSPMTVQTIEKMNVAVDDFSTEAGKTAKVLTNFKLNRQGNVDVSGQLKLVPLDMNLKLALKSIDLLPLETYFKDRLTIDLTRGQLTIDGTLQMRQPPGNGFDLAKFNGGFTGNLTVADVHAVDKLNAADFLRWKSLHVGHLDARLQPRTVSIGDVALSDFFARVIISREGKLNLLQVVRQAEAEPAAKTPHHPPAAEKSSGTSVATAASPPMPLKIDKVTLQGGDIKFTDNFVKPNYSANLKKIAGTISGLSTAPDSIATVDLRGSYDNIAPLSINGRVNPLAAKPFLDIEADVKGVELTSLSPYSGKYAGYAIDKGKLSVFVKYKIENNQLTAENRLFLDQLTFGNPVDSADATKLPVTLAVALLKNRNGEIDINLPISGSLNDPEFSVGGLVVKVIVNLLVKAVTSPFALLGSIFGGGEQLSQVEFDAGKAIVSPSAQSGLDNLSKALLDRPALKLEIEGRADPDVDTEGLKRERINERVERLLRNDLAKKGVPVDANAPLEVGGKDYPALLERVYRAEKFPKPRNALGLVKTLPVDEMEKLLLAHSSVDDDDLRELADRRAKTVRDALLDKTIPAERIFLIPVKLGKSDGKTDGKSETAAGGKISGVVFSLK